MSWRALWFWLLLPALGYGQDRAALERARAQYAAGEFGAVVRTLRRQPRLEDAAPGAALLLAASYYHTNELTPARQLLDRLTERRAGDYRLAHFFRGRIYHAQNLFAEAATEYKTYLRGQEPDGPEWVTVSGLLRNAANGLRLSVPAERVLVDNLGETVNGPGDEFGPIPSPTGGGRVYFTQLQTSLPGVAAHTDVRVTRAVGQGWAAGESLDPLLNTFQHEVLSDLSPDGGRLYYFRGAAGGRGAYLLDTFRTTNQTDLVTIPLDVPLSVNNVDVTPFFGAADAVYFASDRPDGYGGLDLYRRRRLPGGGYGPSENLGPRVNGPYDEVCPFVARDGRTLYFSTNDPEYSVGGFDVVRSFRVVGAENQFTRPVNVGLPVNSAGDDTHFRLAPDTFTGFLASDRKDGFGMRDLYVVYYPTARPEMGGE